MNIVNTNARSLCPKIHSLLDCFVELKIDLAILTETWLTDGEGLEEDIEDLREGSGLGQNSRFLKAGPYCAAGPATTPLFLTSSMGCEFG